MPFSLCSVFAGVGDRHIWPFHLVNTIMVALEGSVPLEVLVLPVAFGVTVSKCPYGSHELYLPVSGTSTSMAAGSF